jgi:hypothetical protein
LTIWMRRYSNPLKEQSQMMLSRWSKLPTRMRVDSTLLNTVLFS